MMVDNAYSDSSPLRNMDGIEEFTRTLSARSKEVADYYYGLLTKAAESNDEQDLNAVSEAFQKVMDKFKDPTTNTYRDPLQEFKHYIGRLDERTLSKVIDCNLMVCFPDYHRPINNYYTTGKKLDAMLAKLKGDGQPEQQ
jgi:hypothetical protein